MPNIADLLYNYSNKVDGEVKYLIMSNDIEVNVFTSEAYDSQDYIDNNVCNNSMKSLRLKDGYLIAGVVRHARNGVEILDFIHSKRWMSDPTGMIINNSIEVVP
jgi:hypothetical protein